MEYKELDDVYEFHRNMRRTPWTQLFPHWWDDQDALLVAIGNEVERIKALAVFSLLNAGIKPPVLLWQESVDHKEYHFNFNATSLPYSATMQAPLYKTWGKITLTNNTEKDLDGLIIKLDDSHGYVINQLISQSDIIVIDLTEQKTTLNNEVIQPQKIGDGLPYFVTQKNNDTYIEDTPLHNEVIRLSVETHLNKEISCDIDIDVQLNNVVFTNEQNIEITALEAVPIERVELYAEYDFRFNRPYNGWHKVYDKKYDSKTNVVADMITTQFYTKKFYVDVYFKTLQYPYRVGFPCYKDAEENSMYHVNNRIDSWGTQLGLERRMYKTDISEEEYYKTFPIFYPFDIEQDYWYYRRLTHEYAWNDLAKNDVDLLDTDGDPIVRLYAIDPFMEDLVIHAKSKYPTDKEFVDYNDYMPIAVMQRNIEDIGVQTPYSDIINLLSDDQKRSTIILNNKTDNNDVVYKKRTSAYIKKKEEILEKQNSNISLTKTELQIIKDSPSNTLTKEEQEQIIEGATESIKYIESATHQSTELITYFDLSTLPEDVNIDDIEIIVEADSTDNKTNKKATEKTGILIPDYKGNEQTFIPLTADKPYQLKKKLINYANNDIHTQLSKIEIQDNTVSQSYTIKEFQGKIKDFIKIPFTLTENNEEVNDITDVWVYYNDTIRKASYRENNGEKYIYAYVPNTQINQITIICKSKTHYPFTCKIDVSKAIQYEEETNKALYEYIAGPLVDGVIEETIQNNTEWRTDDIRNLIQKQGIYFRHVLTNEDEQSSTTVHLYNIKAKISYSEKKADFTMSTYIKRGNIDKSYLGSYYISLKNIGDKALSTHVDIFTPPNIKLEKNHIEVNLNPNQGITIDEETGGIKIAPNYPIDDGFYDIVTVCEDKIKKNTIEVFSDGLIETGVNMSSHSCRYNDTITLKAEVAPLDGSIIDGAKGKFYIDGYSVGETTVRKNKMELTISPSDNRFKFITSGNLILEAKFLGTTKYAPSSKRTSLFISKEDTRITLIANELAPYKGGFNLKAKVEYYDGQHYLPVDNGSVTFYIDDEILSSNATLLNGVFTSAINEVQNPAGNYILYARYSGSDIYASTETSQPLKIIGGNVRIAVYDIDAKPKDIINLKARVLDMNNEKVINSYVDFYIKDKDGNYIDFGLSNFDELTKNIEINDGIATSQDIQLNIDLDSDFNTKRYTIEARYHYSIEDNADDMSLYQVSDPNGFLNITKGDIDLTYQSVFYGTQYEPLGFIISVQDSNTKQPVSNGKIVLSLKNENDTIEQTIDSDGIARFLYNPLEFTAKEWEELEKFSFDVVSDNLWKTYNGDTPNKYVDFLYNQQDGTLHYVGNKPDDIDDLSAIRFDTNTGKYYIDNEALQQRDVSEHIYITNGNLYARTTKDVLRQYTIGLQDIEIKYLSDGQYKNKTEQLTNGLNINTTNVDLDIHSYDLYYTDNTPITCYVTQYHFTDDGVADDIVNDGSVMFSIDNQEIDTIDIVQGKAQLDNKMLSTVSAGNHLLQVKYVANQSQSVNYSYSYLNLKRQQPPLSIHVERHTPGKSTNVYVTFDVDTANNIPLTGMVNLYLNGQLIDTQFLNGTENIPGIVEEPILYPVDDEQQYYKIGAIFNIVVPEDITTNTYILTASYEGNEFFLPNDTFNEPYYLTLRKVDVDINIKDNIYVAKNESCFIDAYISYKDDIINEGELVLRYGDEEITSSNVLDNKARLYWTAQETDAAYDVIYRNANNYNDKVVTLQIHVIDALDEISVPKDMQTIEEALMCLKTEGTIYITSDVLLTQSIEINKDCNIIGHNDVSLIKDVSDLITDNIIVYSIEDVESMHLVDGLSLINLNTTDFIYTEKQLYAKTRTALIPLYLAEDGQFYSETSVQLKDMLTEVNLIINEDVNVTLNNIIFKSNDSNSIADFAIYNKGTCSITHSIIESTAKIYNKGDLTAHRNLIYGICQGQSDLDNNWWGSNIPPYTVNNHIVLKVFPKDTPAVVSEEVKIVGELIGTNGQYYNIPQTDFMFTADTGYFSIDTGKLINGKVTTTYLDAEKEGSVYLTVDNQTVECPIYGYERKTEVIIDDIDEVVINYQVPITAKVQSCADTYYEFDEYNNIIKSTQAIDEGFVSFYISQENSDRKQIGYAKVNKGIAIANVFFTELVYNINEQYIIEAEYHADKNYFDSSSSMKITVINGDNIIFVSPLGDDTNSGSYGSPIATISKALQLDKNNIYLFDGIYNETNIQINKNVTIKRYNGSVVFQNLTGDTIFNIFNDTIVNITGIDFINNNTSYIVDNAGNLNISKCIFYNNKNILFKNISNVFNVTLSAIVDNTAISSPLNTNNYSKCWFGKNTPENGFNNYILMSHEQSKNRIYIGTLAHITAKLDTYIDNGTIHQLEEKLPLRIAKFATEIGSTKPIKDYTYNNYSTSLINTLDTNNNYQYVITSDTNTFYDKNSITLKYYIQDVFGNNIDIQDNQPQILEVYIQEIDTTYSISINQGIAELTRLPLPIGRYHVKCSYKNSEQIYTLSTFFDVKPLDIIITNCTTDNNSHLYYTEINADVKDNFGNNINNQQVNISIDDVIIKTISITKGKINEKIQYNLLTAGQHKISIDNNNINTEYDKLYYEFPIVSRPQKTYISFDYDTIEANIYNNLIVEINDEEGREVQTGIINVNIDDTVFNESIPVSNGIAVIRNLKITEKGQHSITIQYSDINRYYEYSSMINSTLGVGIFNIQCSISEGDIINADIGKDFTHELTVQDKGYQRVDGGYINIYIDGALFSEHNTVRSGLTTISQPLPDGISAGMHRLTIEYLGNSNYLDTLIHAFLNIGQIETDIVVDTVSGSSGQQAIATYNINSLYGIVNTGQISVFFNNNGDEVFLNVTPVTDNIINQVAFKLPLIEAGNDYQLIFKYHDTENNYKDSQTSTKLIVDRSKVVITPSTTWFYPQKPLNLSIDVQDKEGHIVNNGKIDLYIDNVKEYENINVLNGQAIVPNLIFNTARDYNLKIVYQADEYYNYTECSITFNVNNISIDESSVSFRDDLKGLPNTIHANEILFDIGDYNIKDGVIDLLFDGSIVGSYYMAENNKNISFNIGQAEKGQHDLTIKYYDSSLFKPFEKTFTFTVLSKTIDLRINKSGINSQDINALGNDTISISTNIGEIQNDEWINIPITGIIKYYLIIPQYTVDNAGNNIINGYYERYIGLEEFDDEYMHDEPFQYTLTTDLLEYIQNTFENQYQIKAHFIGNTEYEEAEESVFLNIHKQTVTLSVQQELIFDYQDSTNISIKMFDSNNQYVVGKEMVDVLINSKFVGSCVLMDGRGAFKYRLDDAYTVGTYDLTIIFNGSAVNRETTVSTTFMIKSATPTLKTDVIDAYVGGTVVLDNIILDKNGSIINEGEVTYSLLDFQIPPERAGKEIVFVMPETITTNQQLKVEYVSSDLTKYSSFTSYIPVNVHKNPINLSIYAPSRVYRGESFDVTIKATTSTTSIPIHLSFKKGAETYVMQNGTLTTQMVYSTALNENTVISDTISTEGNDVFESASIQLELQFKNKDRITVDPTATETSTTVHTLNQAIDLISDYGTIEVTGSLPEESITLNKSVTLEGDAELTDFSIINLNKKLTIKGITFTASNNTTLTKQYIYNEGILELEECSFKNAPAGAIYTNGSATIEKCNFENNNNQDGSCIYIENKNYKTIIKDCHFNENNASLYGGCIYSKTGNDVEILNNEFASQNYATNGGSCIYGIGNMTISSNSFYGNKGRNQIHLVGGIFTVDNNLFDGNIQSIFLQNENAEIDADLNYWGYNELEDIISQNPGITINNYLIGETTFSTEEGIEYITYTIDKYINSLEKEITTINRLEKTFPKINNE